MLQTARELQQRGRPDPRVPVVVTGTVLAIELDGSLRVSLTGRDPRGGTVRAAADRRFPAPSPGPVVLLYALGSYTVLACPAAPVPPGPLPTTTA